MSDSDLRNHLLSTAARLFHKQGYATVSLRKIAAEAGVTTGSLYYYFQDKDEVVYEILESGHRRVLFQVRRSVEALGPRASYAARVRVAIRSHLGVLFESDSFPAANIRIFAHVPPHLRTAVRAGRRAYEDYWIALLSAPGSEGPQRIGARQLAMFLLSAANSTLEWRRPGRESLDEIADGLTFIFVGRSGAPAAATPSVRKVI